jgi:hypothetical protein
MYQRR